MPTIVYSEGNDTVSHSTATTDTLALLGGNDTLTVFAGTVTAFMGEGDDVVSLRGGTTSAYGESGVDRFDFYVGGFASGGGDDDVFNVRGGGGITGVGGSGDDRFNFAAAATGVLMVGGIGNDIFAGANLAITTAEMHGEDGNDLFTGFRSGVTLYGGIGDDTYRVNPLSNATFVEAVGSGSDIVQLMRGADYVLPDNIERIIVGTYAGSDGTSATITMNGLANAFTGHGNDETVNGLGGIDRLFGKAGNDTLDGGDGNDLLDGGAGNDILRGGVGDDLLVGRIGDDSMSGGAGNDTYYVDTALDTILEGIGEGTDTVRFTLTDYTLAPNVEIGIASGAGATTVHGNALGNSLYGTANADFIYGEDGNDHLYGRAGNDVMQGGNGDDTLRGEAGGDSLWGAAGLDRYFYLAVSDSPAAGPWDYISIDAEDYVNLNGIDADSTTAGNQDFTMVASPTNTPGEMWVSPAVEFVGVDEWGLPIFAVTGSYIYGDVNGDGTADLLIQTSLGLDTTHIIG